MTGVIVTIEGSDGSGKKTQTKNIVELARSKGYLVETKSFPQYDGFWGKLIKYYLGGALGNLNSVDPKNASVLYAYDRLNAQPEIKKWLSEDKNVILDRYMESNYGYSGGKFKTLQERIDIIGWIYDLEVNQLKIKPSDYVVYLDLPVEYTQKAMKDEGRVQDIHENDFEYLLRVQETYRMFVDNNEDWIRIDCLKDGQRIPEKELTEIIWLNIEPLLFKNCNLTNSFSRNLLEKLE